jgi:sarcosine oxidase subunit gamma
VSHPTKISRIELQDHSALPRFGLKGISTQSWLDDHSYCVGELSNQAYPQADGCIAARLSPRELLFVCDPEHPRLSLNPDYSSPGRECYMIRRQDSHYWFSITGSESSSMLAKLCGVNLDPANFANFQVAQTQLAGTSVILLRKDSDETLAYYLLGDSSYFAYMKACLQDAMREYE